MGFSLGLGLIGLRFFHLILHGVRKALLFISAGKLMINFNHHQDLRKFNTEKNLNLISLYTLI
jgi:NADH:ubiquinone oxidoreductase subunit 5 (subunit L)/multisubunit Na+/H+ antiporter MnhA subunit